MARDFELAKPFLLTLSVTGTEDRPPSFFADATVAIPGHQASLRFAARVFLLCANWSDFTDTVVGSEDVEATLADFDDQLTLSFGRKTGRARLGLECRLPHPHRQASLSFASELDEDDMAALRTAFQDFPIWW